MKIFYHGLELNTPYIFIPGGSYKYALDDNEVTVPDFYFAKYPVTNKLYRRFIAFLEGNGEIFIEPFAKSLLAKAESIPGFTEYLGNIPGSWADKMRSRHDNDKRFNGDDQPVVGVTWFAANAYCHWLNELQRTTHNDTQTTWVFKLPTEEEWEWAASGGTRKYPWGNESPDETRANYNENVGQTTPVGRYPNGATPEGLMDMAGNVWEWQENLFWDADYPNARGLRGGSWVSLADGLPCAIRYRNVPVISYYFVGFRVARAQSSF